MDLPFSYVDGRDIAVIFYYYMVDEKSYPDNMGKDPSALTHFYDLLSEGKMPTTSQINEYQYEEYFDALVQKGDVLHIAFGSGMSPSVANAQKAALMIRDRYPDRKLEVIDSMCSSSGYGLLVDSAADLKDQGHTLEEVSAWVVQNRQFVHHQFFSTDLRYFRKSGRVSGPVATLGSLLNICPIMRLDDRGKIIAYSMVRGRKNALQTTLQAMEAHARGGRKYADKCFICHSNCLDTAMELKSLIGERFPHIKGEIRICDIGPIIASHAGPGTTAVFFYGDMREPFPPVKK